MPTPLETWRMISDTQLKRLRDGFVVTITPPPPVSPKPWFGHIDVRNRGTGTGYLPFDNILRANIGGAGRVGAFMHGYSSGSTPGSFSSSNVSTAPSLGVGAMLNIKNNGDWAGAANGNYDQTWKNFFNSWPVGTFGEVTWQHEPENDGPSGKNNPAVAGWPAWADANAHLWNAGVARFVDVAGKIIRTRGLDVKVGGCLMDFSWDTTSHTWWEWWKLPSIQDNLDVVSMQIDIYKHHNSAGVAGDIRPRFNQILAEARAVGIPSFSVFETGISRTTQYDNTTFTGTDTSVSNWWSGYRDFLEAIPEVRMVCEFHDPVGFASQNAYLDDTQAGVALVNYATICMNGRRDGVTG